MTLIVQNRKRHSSPHREFYTADVVQENLPTVDLILCRDCLAHLPIVDVSAAIENFRSSHSHYLAATTFPGTRKNTDNSTWRVNAAPPRPFQPGDYRALNLQLAPFYLPEPIEIVDEHNKDGKMLGIWELWPKM